MTIIIDDGTATTPNILLTGSWNYRDESSKPNSWLATGSRFAYAGGDVETATYTPTFPREGLWRVSLWWPTFPWTNNALVEVNHNAGKTSYRVNQAANSGKWNPMGYFGFDRGTTGNVVISSEGTNPGSFDVGPVADAVRFEFAGGWIRPTAAVASSTVDPVRRGPANAINGSGMSDANADGIFDTHQVSDFGYDYSWLSGSGDTAGWYAIDLGKAFELFQMELYNFNATAGNTNRGVSSADLYVSVLPSPGLAPPDFSNTSVWQLVAADVSFQAAPGTSSYNTPTLVDLGGVVGRWVALDIRGNLGNPSFVGLSEVQLFGVVVPEPSTLALLVSLAIPGFGIGGRRFLRRSGRAP